MPAKSLWIPPLILALLGVLFGCFPHIIGDWIAQPTVNSIMKVKTDFHLQIWHGFNLVLLLSALTIILGTILYFINKPNPRKLQWIERLNFIAPLTIFQKHISAFTIFQQVTPTTFIMDTYVPIF